MTTLTYTHIPSRERVESLADRAPGTAFSAFLYDKSLARAEKAGMAARRATLLSRAEGRVIEVGAGTGLNAGSYPAGLERLVLAEPDLHMVKRLRHRVEGLGGEAEVVRAPAEALPFEDGSFDTVVSTMVLCTVQDQVAAIAEIRRMLAPGGTLLFMEHVRSEESRLARRQDRFHKPWAWWAAGCRCNQQTLELLRAGGFTTGPVEHAEWTKMSSVVRPLVLGRAQVAG